jgi:hypothetical protein
VAFDQNKLDQSLKAYQQWAVSEETRRQLINVKTLLEIEIAAMKSEQTEAG